MGSVAWKVLAGVTGIAATKVAAKATNAGWQATTGRPAPKGKHDPSVSNKQAALYAVLSTAVIAGAKVFAERKAADYYTKSAGHAPKALEKQLGTAGAKADKAHA